MAALSRLGKQIEQLISTLNATDALDMAEVREYFRLFGKEQLLQELVK